MAEEMENRLTGLEQTQQEVGENIHEMQNQLKNIMNLLSAIASDKGKSHAEEVPHPSQEHENIPIPPSQAYQPDNVHHGSTSKAHHKPSENAADTFEIPIHTEFPPTWKQLEERLKAIEGTNTHGVIDAQELCLVPNITLPQKFKMPDFEKFSGSQCPQTHLTMYCRKMAAYVEDDKILMHCFQESLTGGALRWYIQLEGSRVRTWKELAAAFLTQYKHVTELAPDRLALQGLEKRQDESFKAYARRWREMAVEVQPPLTERELTTLFINTLKGVYYDKLIGNVSSSFADLVSSGERIESGIKEGKINKDNAEAVKRIPQLNKRKEGEAHPVWQHQPRYRGNMGPPPNFPSAVYYGAPPPITANITPAPQPYVPVYQPQRMPQDVFPRARPPPGQFRAPYVPPKVNRDQERPKQIIEPIPMTYTELYSKLLEAGVVSPVPLSEIKPPFPSWYDPEAHCEYHASGAGHNLENCMAFKRKVQSLRDAKWLDFSTMASSPNVNTNPLPEHSGNAANVISQDRGILKSIVDIKMKKEKLFKLLCQYGYLLPEAKTVRTSNEQCLYHGNSDHSIEQCTEFLDKVQESMNQGRIEFSTQLSKAEAHMIQGSNPSVQIIIHKPSVGECLMPPEIPEMPHGIAPLTIQVPSPFPYQSNKTVPWKYDCQIIKLGQPLSTETSSLAEMEKRTRSGRLYAPLEIDAKAKRGKEPLEAEVTPTRVHQGPTANEDESDEFLKIIKQSEYNIVDQLSKQPARISLLSLLLNSLPHREALMKVLSQAYVPPTISVQNMDEMANNIAVDKFISFGEDELPPEGRGHIKALHISVEYKGYIISRVLIDNGASLNIMPVRVLSQLPVDSTSVRPSNMVVRAFDGTKRDVIGTLELPLQIGPCTFSVEFQIMDISPYYSCLLGRPWLHSTGAVPSSLHQKVKFVVNQQIVSISAEEDILISKPSTVPYIEVGKDIPECSFRSFEVVNASFEAKATRMVAKVMTKNGYKPGEGLGLHAQGIKAPLTPKGNIGRYGLGYKTKETKHHQEEGRPVQENEKGIFPPLTTTFTSAGIIFADAGTTVAMFGVDTSITEGTTWVRQKMPGEQLNNWTSLDLPVITM